LARRANVASVLPEDSWRWGLAFLGVSLASAALSVVRGETLYLLLRGRVDPLVVNSLGMTASNRTATAVRVFLSLVLLLLAADAFSRLARTAQGRRWLLVAVSAGAALAALSPLLRFAPIEGTVGYWKLIGRASGTFTDPNALGIGLAVLTPLLAAAFLELRGALRAIPAVGLLLIPFALERSGSRTALIILAVAAAGAAIGGYRSGGKARRAVLFAGGGALLLVGVLLFAAPRGGPAAAGGLVRRVGGALSARSVVELTSHRPFFWRAALDEIREEPLSGCGLGGFAFEFPAWYERTNGPALFTDNAANGFLDVAAESGIPALFLAAGAVLPLFLLAARTIAAPWPGAGWPALAGAGAVLGLLAASFTGSHLRIPEVAIGAALAAAFLPYPDRSSKPEPEGALGPKRVLLVLSLGGALASGVAALPSLRPAAPFRVSGGRWVGVYPPEGSAPSRVQWTGRRIVRLADKGEGEMRVTLENVRPDGRPVLAAFRVDEVSAGSAVLPADGPRTLAVRPLPRGGGVVTVTFSPVFVPAENSGSGDRRTLGVLLRSPAGEAR
jgi:O-antigen ligase